MVCQEPFLLGDTKSVSGAPPGFLAGALSLLVFIAVSFDVISSSVHEHKAIVTALVHEVQVITGLRSHALLDTFRLQCCVCRPNLIQSPENMIADQFGSPKDMCYRRKRKVSFQKVAPQLVCLPAECFLAKCRRVSDTGLISDVLFLFPDL